MPSGPLQFRAACGCFTPVFVAFMMKRAEESVAMRMRTLVPKDRVAGVTVGFLLVYLYWGSIMLQANDIELNPGPTSGTGPSTMRQTRLASATGAGSRASMERPGNQPGNTSASSSTSSGEPEPTLSDVMTTLLNMNSKFDKMKDDVKEMKDVYAGLMNEISDLKTEVTDLRRANDSLKAENDALKEKIDVIERKTDDLEDRSKRQNIIIHGLPRDAHEKTWKDCEDVREMIVDKLELTGEMPFDRVHRLTPDKNSPIVARCTFYKDKEEIMRAKGKLKGSKIFLGDDFSKRVRDVRKRLAPHLKNAKSQGKKATMVFDHLLVDGKKFFLSGDDQLCELK